MALILTHTALTEEDPRGTKLPAPAAATPPVGYRKRGPGPCTAGTRSTDVTGTASPPKDERKMDVSLSDKMCFMNVEERGTPHGYMKCEG